jgi:hypothetical protein
LGGGERRFVRFLRRAALFLSVTLPSTAWAAEEELVLGIEPGYALLTTPAGAKHGGVADLSAWLGITETIALAISAGTAAGFSEQDAIIEALGGIVLALDVFRVIPYGEAMIGAYLANDTLAPSYRLGVGADYLISPSFAVGVVARYRGLPDMLGGDGLFTAQLRLALRIEL